MKVKRKHFPEEIAALLAQAEDLAKQGRLQSDIARTLGVSVMTLHRWRKAEALRTLSPVASNETDEVVPAVGPLQRISELKAENTRLRKLVTDLLLEKVKLEESALRQSQLRGRPSRRGPLIYRDQ